MYLMMVIATMQKGKPMDDLISRQAAITQLSHNKNKGDDEWGLAVQNDIQTIWKLPSAQPRWIPVTERLPNHELAIVQYGDGGFDLLQFPTAYRRKDIVAWLPLPEPYETKSEE